MIARVTITKPARWLRREQKEPPNDARNEPCGSSAFLLYGLPLGQSSNHHGHAKDGVPERIPLGVAFGSLSVIERMEKHWQSPRKRFSLSEHSKLPQSREVFNPR
jgi:hypothetical protein